MIPQDPLLFNRSVRQNIDPTESHLDERVWKVLEQSQMKDVVKGLKGGLDHEVEEGKPLGQSMELMYNSRPRWGLVSTLNHKRSIEIR